VEVWNTPAIDAGLILATGNPNAAWSPLRHLLYDRLPCALLQLLSRPSLDRTPENEGMLHCGKVFYDNSMKKKFSEGRSLLLTAG
jgi:hypothetical protein